MGDIIGGIVGGIGSLVGGSSAAGAEKKAAQQSLTGFNYLSGNPLIQQAQNNARDAMGNQDASLEASTTANNNAQSAQNNIGQLLTSDQSNNPAYQNYLNSTGYQFQQKQGMDAITGSAAARGLVNSGATAKALTAYGQGLAGQSFNNYLGQLQNNAAGQLNNATGYNNLAQGYNTLVGQGLTAATATGQAGTTGGGNAGTQTAAAGNSTGTSIAQAANYLGGGLQNGINSGQIANFFGGV